MPERPDEPFCFDRSRLALAGLLCCADEVPAAYVTLLVHAGIAASDVICCARLGVHAQGQDHVEAAALLGKVDKKLANDLTTLLGLKTRVGYGANDISAKDQQRAARACARLMEAAQAVI